MPSFSLSLFGAGLLFGCRIPYIAHGDLFRYRDPSLTIHAINNWGWVVEGKFECLRLEQSGVRGCTPRSDASM